MELLYSYLINLFFGVPKEVYILELLVLCFGVLLISVLVGKKRAGHFCLIMILLEYVFLICCSTIFFRETSNVKTFNFTPFWSYKSIIEGKEHILLEVIMNIMVFVPVGFLLGMITSKNGWKKSASLGAGLSIVIESVQFCLNKGFSEVDDVMHNTFGCVIGYGIYYGISETYKMINK